MKEGESLEDVYNRAKGFLDFLLEKHKSLPKKASET